MKVPIVNNDGMICPRCEKRQDILSYIQLGQENVDIYSTIPMYKCGNCRFVFAPVPDLFDFTESF